MVYLPVVLALRGKAAGPEFVARSPESSALAGLAAFGGYAIVVWAMTQASNRRRSPRCENALSCSPLIIGVAFLGEPFRGARAGAALLIVGGVITLRLA